MNSKRRCTFCGGYFEAETMQKVGLSGVCSSQCLSDLQDKSRNKRARRILHRENRVRYGRRLPGNVRDAVRARDGHRCRYCGKGSGRLEIHHINYRSQGGRDEETNLILLCDEHHRLMHSNKRHWQPVLKMVMYAYYFENRKVMVSKADRELSALLVKMDLPGDWTDAPE